MREIRTYPEWEPGPGNQVRKPGNKRVRGREPGAENLQGEGAGT